MASAVLQARVAAVRDVVVEVGRIDDSEPRAGEPLLAGEPGMLSRCRPAAARARRPSSMPASSSLGTVAGRDRTIGDAPGGRHHFDQRLEPVQAARTIAHDAHRAAARRRPRLSSALRHPIGAQRNGAGIAGHEDGDRSALMRARPTRSASSSKRSGVTRPCSSPLTIIDGCAGAVAQAVHGFERDAAVGAWSRRSSTPSRLRANSSSARAFIDWQASARHSCTR